MAIGQMTVEQFLQDYMVIKYRSRTYGCRQMGGHFATHSLNEDLGKT
jgi:hypothetical protein